MPIHWKSLFPTGILFAFVLSVPSAGDETNPRKLLIPEPDLKPLVKQAAREIMEAISMGKPEAKAADKARALAVLIAAYAEAGMGGEKSPDPKLVGLRHAGIRLAGMIRDKAAEQKDIKRVLGATKEKKEAAAGLEDVSGRRAPPIPRPPL